MTQTRPRTLQEIKRDSEIARASLTNTVDELRTSVTETASDFRQMISPSSIRAEVNNYVRSRGEELLETVTTAARNNPMQAVAIGASVAYPLMRVARSIPVPVLMIGAGLFLAGSKTGQATARRMSDAASNLASRAGNRVQDLKSGLDGAVATAKEYAAGGIADATDAVAAGMDAVTKATSAGLAMNTGENLETQARKARASIADKAADLTDTSSEMAKSLAASAKDAASHATAVIREGVDHSLDAGAAAADTVRHRAAELGDRAAKGFIATVEQNPLVVAGLGLLVGGVIAGALPRSDLEDDLVGGASTGLKKRARDAASRGLDVAKDVASGVYDDVARRAGEEGLTPDRLSETTRDVGQRLRNVADAAVTTAFEATDHHNHQHDIDKGTRHD